jgi:hypothetical protein
MGLQNARSTTILLSPIFLSYFIVQALCIVELAIPGSLLAIGKGDRKMGDR